MINARATALAGLLAAVTFCVGAVIPVRDGMAADKPTVTEEANKALLQMAQTLHDKEFSFKARTLRVYADEDGKFLHIGHNLKVLVRRPGGMRVDRDGDDGASQLFYDGTTVVLYGPAKKEYVSLPAPNTLSGMLEEIVYRTGVDFPLADFLTDAPDKAILTGVKMGKILNTVTIDGTPCLHLMLFQPPGLELELWLEKTDQALPRRLFITHRSVPGQPTFIAEFSDWNFSVKPTDADFTFQPPENAKQVELKSPAAPLVKAKGTAR